jgi:hypothetical protein
MTTKISEVLENSEIHAVAETEIQRPEQAHSVQSLPKPLTGILVPVQTLPLLPIPGQPGQPVSMNQTLGYIAVIVVLAIGYFAMVLMSFNSSAPRLTATQTLDPPAQPFWIKNLPIAQRSGALPSTISQSEPPRPAPALR